MNLIWVKFTFFRQRKVPPLPGVYLIQSEIGPIAAAHCIDLRVQFALQFTEPSTRALTDALINSEEMSFGYMAIDSETDRTTTARDLLTCLQES